MLQDEIETIVSRLSAEDRDSIRKLPEESLISLHRTLGRTLRNGFRLNTYPWLFTHCNRHVKPEDRSLDALSQIAIRLIWEHLRKSSAVD